MLASPKPPQIGKEFVTTVSNLVPGKDGVVVIGDSDTRWNQSTLPINLWMLGGANCTLYVAGTCIEFCATGNGTVTMRAVVPNNRNFIGATFFMQFWSPDAGSNPSGFAMSNAGKFVVGG